MKILHTADWHLGQTFMNTAVMMSMFVSLTGYAGKSKNVRLMYSSLPEIYLTGRTLPQNLNGCITLFSAG